MVTHGRVIAASEAEDLEGRALGVDVVIRFYYEDNEDGVEEIVRHLGKPEVGVTLEDGSGAPVLKVKQNEEEGQA